MKTLVLSRSATQGRAGVGVGTGAHVLTHTSCHYSVPSAQPGVQWWWAVQPEPAQALGAIVGFLGGA